MDRRRDTENRRKRPGIARCAALAFALGATLYAGIAAAALVFGQVSGIDSPDATFEVSGNGQHVTVKVSNRKYEVILPPGQYTATYKGKQATLVSYPRSTRQDITFK